MSYQFGLYVFLIGLFYRSANEEIFDLKSIEFARSHYNSEILMKLKILRMNENLAKDLVERINNVYGILSSTVVICFFFQIVYGVTFYIIKDDQYAASSAMWMAFFGFQVISVLAGCVYTSNQVMRKRLAKLVGGRNSHFTQDEVLV